MESKNMEVIYWLQHRQLINRKFPPNSSFTFRRTYSPMANIFLTKVVVMLTIDVLEYAGC